MARSKSWIFIIHDTPYRQSARTNYFSIYLDFRYIEIYIAVMRSNHRGGAGRHFKSGKHMGHHGLERDRAGYERPGNPEYRGRPDRDNTDQEHAERGHRRGHHGRGHGRGGRLFDYGDLRLLLLAMIAERPCHGYELIKAIEERAGGSYAPSPGVVYPTLAWLDDMGYAAIDAEDGGRKRYRITAEGEAFLAANRAMVDALLARIASPGTGRGDIPAPLIRAMENLKLAMRLRLRRGPIDQPTAEAIAAALDTAAQAVERS
jgi:DNA-binding PadR family transcriptional regulator